jgi:pyruvate dehydrogenase E1 component
MSSFIAAGSAYANHGVSTIPFYIYYSMFGFQRIGDLIWAAGDMRARGFLLGGTAGRTTLNGEGLQHEDGHSHVHAYTVPNVVAYDPAYAYELAAIIKDGIRRMYGDGEDVFFYITLMNENYAHPPMPDGAEEGILKGAYKLSPGSAKKDAPRATLFGSGTILNEVVKAQEILGEKYGVFADVFSVTSYKELYRDALACDRWNMLNPEKTQRIPYVSELVGRKTDVLVAASDYMKVLPDSISRWLPAPLHSLGTDGFGRSETRESLRDFFEVDARYIVLATLHNLARLGKLDAKVPAAAIKDLGIDPEKQNPHTS